MSYIARLGIIFVGVLFANRISPGVQVFNHWYVFFWAFLVAGVNAYIRTFCDNLSWKRTWGLMAIFSLAINIFAYWLVFLGVFTWMGYNIMGFGSAFFAAIIVSVVSTVCNHFIGINVDVDK